MINEIKTLLDARFAVVDEKLNRIEQKLDLSMKIHDNQILTLDKRIDRFRSTCFWGIPICIGIITTIVRLIF